jgi:hypothetical protein
VSSPAAAFRIARRRAAQPATTSCEKAAKSCAFRLSRPSRIIPQPMSFHSGSESPPSMARQLSLRSASSPWRFFSHSTQARRSSGSRTGWLLQMRSGGEYEGSLIRSQCTQGTPR